MRKSNQEISDTEILNQIIEACTIIRVAIPNQEVPYLLPFNYGFNEGCFFIHSAPEGLKLEQLKNQPRVSFEITQGGELVEAENACNWSTRYRSVTGSGRVEFLHEPAQKFEALRAIMFQHGASEDPEFNHSGLEKIVIWKIIPDKLQGKKSSNWDRIIEKNTLYLSSARLELREIGPEDLDDLHRLHSIPEVDEYNTLGIPANKNESLKLLNSMINSRYSSERSSYTWKILLKDTGEFIGLAGLNLSLDRFRLGEIYYKFDPAYWGKGYATETAKLLIRTGFNHFSLQKVEAGVATENLGSIRVLEKCGMTCEGLRRKILPIRGEWKDNFHYAIVRDDPVPG